MEEDLWDLDLEDLDLEDLDLEDLLKGVVVVEEEEEVESAEEVEDSEEMESAEEVEESWDSDSAEEVEALWDLDLEDLLKCVEDLWDLDLEDLLEGVVELSSEEEEPNFLLFQFQCLCLCEYASNESLMLVVEWNNAWRRCRRCGYSQFPVRVGAVRLPQKRLILVERIIRLCECNLECSDGEKE